MEEYQMAIYAIKGMNLSFEEKAQRIEAATSRRTEIFLNRAKAGSESGENNGTASRAEHQGKEHLSQHSLRSCSHYKRNCSFRADCCGGRYFPCRHCHNEEADHTLDRFAISFVACRVCRATDVPVGKDCANCGVEFARYHCNICHLYEDDEESAKEIYHCRSCGICRRGKGLGIDNHHCPTCDCCVPIEMKDSHACRQSALAGHCPICLEGLAESTDTIVFTRCAHALHERCFAAYIETRYVCPLCSRSLADMSAFFKAIDEQLASEEQLTETHGCQKILCNDCGTVSVAKWHYQFRKCNACDSFNTRVLQELLADSAAR
jgi:CHY zinc finger/Zinc-ribbon/Ring finger domain